MTDRRFPVVAAAVVGLLLCSEPALAQAGQWYVRLTGSYVAADGDTDRAPAGVGGRLSVDPAGGPRVDVGRMLTLDLALEASLTVARHDLTLGGPGAPAADAGRLWVTPASVLLTYRWPTFGDLRPHLGGGLAIAVAPYWRAPGDTAALGFDDLSTGVGFGPAAAIGLDWSENDRWFVTLDVRWLDAPIELDVEAAGGALLDTVELDYDPWSINLGIGWRLH